jgi:hypothetical protein
MKIRTITEMIALSPDIPDYGGKKLGLRPGEFEVITWHDQEDQ